MIMIMILIMIASDGPLGSYAEVEQLLRGNEYFSDVNEVTNKI